MSTALMNNFSSSQPVYFVSLACSVVLVRGMHLDAT